MPDPHASSSFVEPLPSLLAIGGAPLYLTGEDALRLTVFNGQAGVIVTITGRMLEFGQQRPTPFTQTLTPATDRSSSTVSFSLGDGWLLNAQVIVSTGAPQVGQTFARVSLVRGLLSNAVETCALCQNYITAKQSVSYPGSNMDRATDGAGALRSIAGATPAAGAEISETVPTGARWELLTFRFQLVTSAAVANRGKQLILDDGVNEYHRVDSSSNQAASLTFFYMHAQGYSAGSAGVGASVMNHLPGNLRMAAGHRIRTLTAAIQAADQYSAVQYLVREWIEGA